jgi:hypothetical protein
MLTPRCGRWEGKAPWQGTCTQYLRRRLGGPRTVSEAVTVEGRRWLASPGCERLREAAGINSPAAARRLACAMWLEIKQLPTREDWVDAP